jgi:Flp pilus assembly protein TadG
MTRRTLRKAKGVTIVEFALVFPFLMMLFFAIFDFGMYFFIQHSVQFATREGVRLALVGRTIANPDGSGTQLDRTASIVQTIKSKAAVAVNPSALQISIFPVDASYADPSGWQTTQDAGQPGSYMRVRTRYMYRFVTPLKFLMPLVLNWTPPESFVISAQATYRNELFDN